MIKQIIHDLVSSGEISHDLLNYPDAVELIVARVKGEELRKEINEQVELKKKQDAVKGR